MNTPESHEIRFGEDGLIPAIVQESSTGEVLMLAFMNDEALRLTRETGRAHYWSRSRKKLWRKGETSGNEQVVENIFINCEQNSLLLRVKQTGAVCHEGYDTCFYRTVDDDGALTVVRERAFDPAMVYGSTLAIEPGPDPLREATRCQFGAYIYLRENDLEGESGTSRRLRQPGQNLRARVADELRELAGVLDGEHQHQDLLSDVRLEASQVMYWVLLETIREGVSWDQLRPDRALATADEILSPVTVAKLLRVEAREWQDAAVANRDPAATAHATLALVSQACRVVGLNPLDAVAADLAELRTRPYLATHFADCAALPLGAKGLTMQRTTDGEEEPRRRNSDPDSTKSVIPERLWTPWRMRYVADGTREEGCIFCNRLAEDDDARTLILHRGDRAFVIMNLFPYNTGHIMIVPNLHVASPENLDAECMTAMCELRAPVLRALRRSLSPEGFNLGLNVGAVAGAGVADHLHEHVVPRWQGDANFMPILASTMVMPELIPVTYAKLRAEFERQMRGDTTAVDVVLSGDRQWVLAEEQTHLPHVVVSDNEPLWRAALQDARARGAHDAELVGWAGESRAGSGPIALLHRTRFTGNDVASPENSFVKVESMMHGPDAEILRIALERFADKP